MPITTSTIPALKAALVDQLTALTAAGEAMEASTVTWGVPKERPSRDWVLVGQVTTNQDDASIGQQKRDEEYSVEIVVSVIRNFADSQRTTTERAFALVAAIESLVRPLTQPPLGVANILWIKVNKTDLEEFFDSAEREARVTLMLGVKARI
jgi:hypothetical protein